MNIYTVAIQKGGTGKTTTAAALAQLAAHKGHKTLAVDLDPQGNLSFTLAADMNRPGTFELLQGAAAADLAQRTPQGLDVIPASWNLSTITSGTGSARRLQKALAQVRGKYDYIFIDTPPTAGELQYNALQAATGVIIPLQANIYNLQSLYQITDAAAQIKASNPELSIAGFILTQYSARTIIARTMQTDIINKAASMGIPYLGTIRAAVALQEAQALQLSLYDYAPKCNPAQDYNDVFNYLTHNRQTISK